jgi:hypothetical protein
MLSVVFFVILSVIMLDVVMLTVVIPILVPLLEVESGKVSKVCRREEL